MPAAADHEPVLRDDTIDLLDGAARINRAIRKLVGYRRCRLQLSCGLRRPIARLHRASQALVDRSNAEPRIGAQMKLSDRAIVAHGPRIGVDLDDPSLGIEPVKMRREAG